MAKKPYFPTESVAQVLWLSTFKDALPNFSTKYGISAAEVTANDNDIEWYKYWFEGHIVLKTFAQTITAFKNEIAYGVPQGNTPSVTPVFPIPAVAPTAVAPGAFNRILSIANRIKSHSAYTIADGEAMGLEGAEQTPVDVNTLRPLLTLVKQADGIKVKWKKGPTSGVEIWVKRGSGAWVFLAMDSTPDYLDTHELPAASEVWEYKAIYHLGDARVGLWSEVVSITVQA